MAKKQSSKTEFIETIGILHGTKAGQEASMYGAIRDLLCDFLDYPRPKVVIDTAGEGGRPDVTCRAPSGLVDARGSETDIDWVVVEAKDERDAFSNPDNREDIFAKKAKYITADTAWFVMVDPEIMVARPVQSAELTPTNDIVFKLDGSEDEAAFQAKFERVKYGVAGVPERLKAFRAGDESGIATEKLIIPDKATKREKNQVQLARRNFFSTLRATTQALQEATLHGLRGLKPKLEEIKAAVEEFGDKYNGYTFRSYPLSISGSPRSLEESRTHDREAARLCRKLKKEPVFAKLALDGLPEFKSRIGVTNEAQIEEMFATETANLVLARILLIRFFEDNGFFGDRRYVCNGGVEAFQKMQEYFDVGYTKLLEEAYRRASRLYAAAFD